ncbi:hypothetical protein M9Y10_031565 [Tritrichomonas musculus]|uniref:Protein kinase domain-containing protein n=1 Tax=Tritrichomonas musculus TaxID=1915356 RepID=A0ABR2H1W7_9EUKA
MIQSNTQDGYPIEIPLRFHSYKIINYLGCGSTCAVFLIEDVNTQKQLSAKVISKKDVEERKIANSVKNEVRMLKEINHPNIIKIHDFFEIKNESEEEYYVIIMDYCKNGDLLNYVINTGFKDDSQKKKIIKKFLETIKYLHDNKISHGDIKSENILLDENFSPILCDFGFCKNTQFAGDDSKNGTLYYAAPELFGKGQFDTMKTDIYAIGITLYSMSALQFPYIEDDQDSIVQQITSGKLTLTGNIDNQLRNIVEKCTCLNPENRPSVEDLLRDDYFNTDDSYLSKDNNYSQRKITSHKNIDLPLPFLEI